jgi:hypothetical protein
MTKLALLGMLALYHLNVLAQAQETADKAVPPATRLEAFTARTGIVVVKGFTTVGVVGSSLGSVKIDARELRDAANPKLREYGITIQVKSSGRVERESTSFVDADEIDSLIRGIDYIAKMDKTVSSLADFEAEYRTKGYFAITTFSSSRGDIQVAVSSGRIGRTTAFLSLPELAQMRSVIEKAKATVDGARAAAK